VSALAPKGVLAIGVALVLWSASAAAQHATQQSSATAQEKVIARLCGADIGARCAVVLGGPERIRSCVKEQLEDLAEPCRARLARLATIKQSCAGDISEYCAGVKRGRGRVEACLSSVLGDLSDPCKDALAQAVSGDW
jgi:hypothetical protein